MDISQIVPMRTIVQLTEITTRLASSEAVLEQFLDELRKTRRGHELHLWGSEVEEG